MLAPPEVQRALGRWRTVAAGLRHHAAAGCAAGRAWKATGSTGSRRLLGRMAAGRGASCAAAPRPPSDPERVLGHELVLDNATFRLLGVTPAWTRYLVMDFRSSAVSDDKRDFVMRLGVNLATGALPDAVITALAPSLDSRRAGSGAAAGGRPAAAMWDRARVVDLVAPRPAPAARTWRWSRSSRAAAATGPRPGPAASLPQRSVPRGDAANGRRCRRATRSARGRSSAATAIGREYRAKLDDLARQYATRVTVEWVQTLELVMPVHRFDVQIRRRKAERTIALGLEPVGPAAGAAGRARPPPAWSGRGWYATTRCIW